MNKKLARFATKFEALATPVLAKHSGYVPPWMTTPDLMCRMEGFAAALRHFEMTVPSHEAFELVCLFKDAVVSCGDHVRWSVQPALYFSVLDIYGFPPNRPPRDLIY